jgi:hypothetical protein
VRLVRLDAGFSSPGHLGFSSDVAWPSNHQMVGPPWATATFSR